MFGGMFRQKPDKEEAMKELKSNATKIALFIAAIRVAPYLLSYFQKEQHLSLDL